jgi:hypothetical protein
MSKIITAYNIFYILGIFYVNYFRYDNGHANSICSIFGSNLLIAYGFSWCVYYSSGLPTYWIC